MLSKSVRFVLIFICLFLDFAQADTPPPFPSVWLLKSANGKYIARMDEIKGALRVYKRKRHRKSVCLWKMRCAFRPLYLSNDGQYLVGGGRSLNLIELDYTHHEPMIFFVHRGILSKKIGLDQVIQSEKHLRRTVSHYAWGNYVYDEPEKSGYFAVETIENRKLYYNIKTGQLIKVEPVNYH